MSLDWDDDEREEGKDQHKEEDQDKDSEKDTPQTNPQIPCGYYLNASAIPKSSIKQFNKRSSVTPEKEEHRCQKLMT